MNLCAFMHLNSFPNSPMSLTVTKVFYSKVVNPFWYQVKLLCIWIRPFSYNSTIYPNPSSVLLLNPDTHKAYV